MKPGNYFYKDQPLFGMDVGFSSVKVMQTVDTGKERQVVGYGVAPIQSNAIKDGVIEDVQSLAESLKKMFEQNIIGEITTRNVAFSIPATRTFTRTLDLPSIKPDEIPDAVVLEAEQYIPMPINDLYIDHVVLSNTEKGIEVLAVATPKIIVDSYIHLANVIGITPVAFDTSILAAARLFRKQDDHNDIPAVLVDFGSMSTDITVHDRTVIVTGTLPKGGDMFTEIISNTLNVSFQEAHVIKTKYGISKSKKQQEILNALRPAIDQLAKEIQRMIRYHEERNASKEKIGQIVAMGGGANMPGLSDYLTNSIRLPVRTCEPLRNFNLHKLRPPSTVEKSMYVTVAGLSLIRPGELFSND